MEHQPVCDCEVIHEDTVRAVREAFMRIAEQRASFADKTLVDFLTVYWRYVGVHATLAIVTAFVVADTDFEFVKGFTANSANGIDFLVDVHIV